MQYSHIHSTQSWGNPFKLPAAEHALYLIAGLAVGYGLGSHHLLALAGVIVAVWVFRDRTQSSANAALPDRSATLAAHTDGGSFSTTDVATPPADPVPARVPDGGSFAHGPFAPPQHLPGQAGSHRR